MTIPRELGIEQIEGQYRVTSQPVKELDAITTELATLIDVDATDYTVENPDNVTTPLSFEITAGNIKDFAMTFTNDAGNELVVGYDKAANQYYIDRTKSGDTSFKSGFGARHTAPRFAKDNRLQLTLVLDDASLELFADGGLTTMTETFFPEGKINGLHLTSKDGLLIDSLRIYHMESIWKK